MLLPWRAATGTVLGLTLGVTGLTAQHRPSGSDPSSPGWLPPVASIVVPGSGQLMMGKERGAVFLAVEALFVARFLALQGEGSRERERYRELALTIARSPFAPTIRDTAFEYFEQLEKFIESGPFDTDPGPALAPPLDEDTFNGSIWALARQTFFANPDSVPDPMSSQYQLAIEFYRRRAVGESFRWSWRDAALEKDLYEQSIRRSDEAFRRATQQMGLLLVNHILSAIDAFVSVRLSHNGRPIGVTSGLWTESRDRTIHGSLRFDIAF